MEIINEVQQVYYINPLGWNICMGVLIILAAAYYTDRRRGEMSRGTRREYVQLQFIDDLINSVEERVLQGVYSREEANEKYREAKKAWPVIDLFPSIELLKENIKTRLAATSKNLPVPLPDCNHKPRRKHMFDKGEPEPVK